MGLAKDMDPANEWRCYIVKWSVIGWAHTQNGPCYLPISFETGPLSFEQSYECPIKPMEFIGMIYNHLFTAKHRMQTMCILTWM